LVLIKKNQNLFSDHIIGSITENTSKQSVVRIFVYPDSHSYTQIDEAPQIDLVALIANIGRKLGLVFGREFV
jgi:hypothetical protein